MQSLNHTGANTPVHADSDRVGQYANAAVHMSLPQFNSRVATPPQYDDAVVCSEAADEHARVKYSGGQNAVVALKGQVAGLPPQPPSKPHSHSPSKHVSSVSALPQQGCADVNHIAKLNVNLEELLIEKLEMKSQIRDLQKQLIDNSSGLGAPGSSSRSL